MQTSLDKQFETERGRSDTKHATPPSKASKRSRLKAAPKGEYEIQKKGVTGLCPARRGRRREIYNTR